MTTIHNLPDEILDVIFEELDGYYLKKCQHVCSAWYKLAHIKLLHKIRLDSYSQTVEKFIASIDHNPDPQYLKAVKSITIRYLDRNTVEYTQEDYSKLFFRFPNLERVYTSDCLNLFKNFDDRTCQALLRNCPKLDTFEVDSTLKNNVRYCHLLYELRDLVTVMKINDIDYAESGFGSLVEFITSFPRLTKIRGVTNRHFNNFQKFLPVLSRLTRFEYMRMGTDENKVDNAESCLAEKTKEERDILITTLSNLKTFKFHSLNGFSVDSLKFASKYLTGLQVFRFEIARLNSSQLQEFCNSVLDLFCSTSDDSNVFVGNVQLETLSMWFSNIVDKVFSLAQTKSILSLNVEKRNNPSIHVALYKRKYERGITLGVSWSHNPQDIASYLFSQNIQLKKVDKFKFTISGRYQYDSFVVNNDTYDMFFQEMPLLKDVTLDIPASYSDDRITYNGKPYTQVENLTLQATQLGKIQSLLDVFCIAFPSLTCLKLYYYSGVLDDDACLFQIDLSAYILETLLVDVTPLKLKMRTRIDHLTIKDNYFILKMTCNNGRQLYKIPLDHY